MSSPIPVGSPAMDYEVEQKFALSSAAVVEMICDALQIEMDEAVEQVDRYFNHPSHDFRETDEAFRLRQVGSQNMVTYKGPRLDKVTKTRQELELPLPPGPEIIAQYTQLWLALGFREAGTVRKFRRHAAFQWQGFSCQLVHDTVDKLGEFIELEIICPASQLEAVRKSLHELAERFELHDPELRSYLEMTLAGG